MPDIRRGLPPQLPFDELGRRQDGRRRRRNGARRLRARRSRRHDLRSGVHRVRARHARRDGLRGQPSTIPTRGSNWCAPTPTRRRGRHSLQVEINKRLYMDEAARARHAGFAPLQAEPAADARGDPRLHPTGKRAVAEHHPIEVRPPDITPYRASSSGVDFVHVFDSGQRRAHGDAAGADARQRVLRRARTDRVAGVRPAPAGGTLIVAFANVAAFARFDFDDPDASRYIDEDYNRVWADDVLRWSARFSGTATRTRVATVRRCRRLPARPALDARARPADHGLRHGRQASRTRAQGRPAGRSADRHRASGGAAHARPRRLQRSGEPEAGLADRMRPALGETCASMSRATPRCASSPPPAACPIDSIAARLTVPLPSAATRRAGHRAGGRPVDGFRVPGADRRPRHRA